MPVRLLDVSLKLIRDANRLLNMRVAERPVAEPRELARRGDGVAYLAPVEALRRQHVDLVSQFVRVDALTFSKWLVGGALLLSLEQVDYVVPNLPPALVIQWRVVQRKLDAGLECFVEDTH